MKTNYHPRNRNRKSGFKQSLIVIGIFIVAAVLLSLSSGVLMSIFSPAWKGQNAFSRSMANTISWTQSRSSLSKENSELKERIRSQEAELVSLRSSELRAEELLGILGRTANEDSIIATVLVRPPETPYDVLLLDAGSRDGVDVGHRVSMVEGPVLGRVIEVSAKTSKVKLYSASNERTNAVLERHGVPVILEGQGGGSFQIDLPRDVAVEEGDRLLSADISAHLLGVVGGIDLAPTDSFKKVLVKSAANMFSLRFVLITP